MAKRFNVTEDGTVLEFNRDLYTGKHENVEVHDYMKDFSYGYYKSLKSFVADNKFNGGIEILQDP